MPRPFDFWKWVLIGDGCWEWTGVIDDGGYGVTSLKNRPWKAHRMSWTLEHGPIPDGLHVCHRCDNRRCVRPGHLFLGTQTDNMRDASAKGRCAKRRGSTNPLAKVTERDVHFIRGLASIGFYHREIAAMYGLSRSGVQLIVSRHNWAHVADAKEAS